MNIFAFTPYPTECAQALDDKRLGKLLLESCEMLCLAYAHHGQAKRVTDLGLTSRLRMSHFNHPCTTWTAARMANWEWLHQHAQALADEYHHRFSKPHACAGEVWLLSGSLPDLPSGPQLEFQNSARNLAKGLDFTHLPVHEAYQTYFAERLKTDVRPGKWTNRTAPTWLKLEEPI